MSQLSSLHQSGAHGTTQLHFLAQKAEADKAAKPQAMAAMEHPTALEIA